nr:methyltransferase domain-containing protein [Streptomyces lichenis]
MTLADERDDRAGEELARYLLDTGALAADWVGTFRAVPRSLFLPELVWAYDMGTGRSEPVHRADADAWRGAAFADVPLVTQWDDGRHTGTAPGTVPTSSASMPSVVTAMLGELDVREDMRVLEIGTGTGWNAGLLAHRLGPGQVVSVEIDGAVAVRARAALTRAGLAGELVHGDGQDGWAAGAPYDRVIVTAGVREVSPHWLAQTRPGGLVLAPFGTHYGGRDGGVGRAL